MLKKLMVLILLVALAGAAFGQLAPSCSRCSSNGKCWTCSGTGIGSSASCSMCNGTGTCYYCSGKGTASVAPAHHH